MLLCGSAVMQVMNEGAQHGSVSQHRIPCFPPIRKRREANLEVINRRADEKVTLKHGGEELKAPDNWRLHS